MKKAVFAKNYKFSTLQSAEMGNGNGGNGVKEMGSVTIVFLTN